MANTADLRKLGDAAAPEQAAVAAAAQAMLAGDGKQVLTGYATALSALAELSKIDAEHTGGWAATRAKLAQTFGQVAGAAGSTGGANVRVILDGALGSADTVVAKAAAAIADWKAKTEAAVKDRQSDTENLQSYASFFRSQATTYGQLRQDLSTFTDPGRGPQRHSDLLRGVRVPLAGCAGAAQHPRHDGRDGRAGRCPERVQEMVSAVDRAISAVQSAYDGVEQSDCYYYDECPSYRDTPGWQRFQSESDAISKQYATAMSAWESATAAEKVAISNRPLPAKPQVCAAGTRSARPRLAATRVQRSYDLVGYVANKRIGHGYLPMSKDSNAPGSVLAKRGPLDVEAMLASAQVSAAQPAGPHAAPQVADLDRLAGPHAILATIGIATAVEEKPPPVVALELGGERLVVLAPPILWRRAGAAIDQAGGTVRVQQTVGQVLDNERKLETGREHRRAVTIQRGGLDSQQRAVPRRVAQLLAADAESDPVRGALAGDAPLLRDAAHTVGLEPAPVRENCARVLGLVVAVTPLGQLISELDSGRTCG